MKKISVVGAGSWGTTLAVLIAEKGYDVTLWVKEEETIESINKERENKQYLPGVKIPKNVCAENSIENSVSNADLIVSSVPAQFTREVAKQYFKLNDNICYLTFLFPK